MDERNREILSAEGDIVTAFLSVRSASLSFTSSSCLFFAFGSDGTPSLTPLSRNTRIDSFQKVLVDPIKVTLISKLLLKGFFQARSLT